MKTNLVGTQKLVLSTVKATC